MTREFVVQCPSWFVLQSDNVDFVHFSCRREKGHEGNHSSNVPTGDVVAESAEGPAVFRLDWRTNDGIVYRRYPKREGK